MFAQSFRFDHHQFQSRMRNAFEPRKPRHRWLRFVVGVIGVGVLALLVMFSVFVGAAMIGASLLYRMWKRRGQPVAASHDPRIVEGEFRVVEPAPLPHQTSSTHSH